MTNQDTNIRLTPQNKADIQGFVTSSFGALPYAAYLFLGIRDRVPAKQWLRQTVQQVTSTAARFNLPAKMQDEPARAFFIALTYDGLDALGLPEEALRSFPPEFRAGMASPQQVRILGDAGSSAPSEWEFGGPSNPAIHVMLILLANSEQSLQEWCGELRESLLEADDGLVEHEGIAQFGARPEHGREHFGFFDGVGQPRIKGLAGKGVNTGEFILGYLNEYGFYPPSPVVPASADPERMLPASPNPNHANAEYLDLGLNGTYVVYRKLAQDVVAFWRFLQDESVRLKKGVDPDFMIWLAAKMVGRWPSGVPLVLEPDRDRPEKRPSDDFLYAEQDTNGLRCPFGSHIRRTNPRDRIRPSGPNESLHMSNRHRILRRGKPYGPSLFDPTLLTRPDRGDALNVILNLQDDNQPRGLHFLCVNANIKGQFEFIQQAWSNNPRFNGLHDNPDPLIGTPAPESGQQGVMVVPKAKSILRTLPIPQFVTTRGGAYFFMPGIAALRYLVT